MSRSGESGRSKKPRSGPGAARGGSPNKALQRAQSLWRDGQFDSALRAFAEAARETPHDPAALIEVGRAFGQRNQIERAMAYLERATRAAPRRADVRFLVGTLLELWGRHRLAQSSFARAAMLAESFPEAELKLADYCERTHQLDEARDHLHRILRARPHWAPAEILMARVLRRQGESDSAESRLHGVAMQSANAPSDRAAANGELALLYDIQQRYAEAWQAILACKAILLQHDQRERQAMEIVLHRFQQFRDDLIDVDPRSLMHPVEKPRKLALMCGFPRSGTTLLEQMLAGHPHLVSSEEQDVFAREIFPNLSDRRSHAMPVIDVLRELSPDTVRRERDRYLSIMQQRLSEPIGDRLHLDKNPALTLMVPVIVSLLPEMRTIVVHRDPRDVFVSCFLRYLPLNPVSVSFLTMDRLIQRMRLDLTAWVSYRRSLPTPWIEVRYEQLVDETERELRRLLSFLELDWDPAVLRHQPTPNRRPVRSPSYEAVLRPVNSDSIGRWRNYASFMAPVLDPLDQLATLVEAG